MPHHTPTFFCCVASRVVVLICDSHLGGIYELDHFGKLRAFSSSASLKTTSIQSHTGRRARRECAGVRIGREWCIGGAGRLLTRLCGSAGCPLSDC